MSIAERVARVRERIAAAADRAGRDPDEVTLVAVSKTHPPRSCTAALVAGVTDLAENRVGEYVDKRPLVDADPTVVTPPRWHFVGRLQSRKATDLVGEQVLIHSVDRRSLVDRIERLAADRGGRQPILVQVNVGDDPRKAGCSLPETDELVAYAAAQSHIAVEGLMTIPPLPPAGTDAGSAARPLFERLRATTDRLGLTVTSMGMSADLEAAVAAGATHVRVGTDVFGPRGDHPWQPVIDRSAP